jgi:hypothetical protein
MYSTGGIEAQIKTDGYSNDPITQIKEQVNKEFQCAKCGKTYLSNPALYLHMKIKHP